MIIVGLMESISQERSSSEILFRTKDKKSFSTEPASSMFTIL